MSIIKKTLLITGGLGYIGSHAVVAFEEVGYKTVIIDNLANSSLENLDAIERILEYKPDFFEVDLRDQEKLEEVFKIYDFDGVIHFAGLKSVGESCEKPLYYFENNITGSLVLLKLMEKYLVKKLLFSSSATVYNPDSKLPFLETGLVGETSNPYGTSKYVLEKIISDLSKFSDFNSINLRYFNPIGVHQSGELGELPDGIPNNLLPYIMQVATGKLEELEVYGNDYDTIDGTGVRDYIDVLDLVEGHIKAYDLLGTKELGYYDEINLGVGKGVSVLEMISQSEDITGKKISYNIADRRSGDLGEVYCDATKAKNILNWESKTSLQESLKNSWEFYKRYN